MSAEFPSGGLSPGNSTFPGNGSFPGNATMWKIPENPERSLRPDVIICAVLTWLVALTFVVLRFYTRCRLKRGILGPTDWCILPALLFSAAVSTSAIDQAIRGVGAHLWEIPFQDFKGLEKASWYGILFYHLSLIFSRISILLLYRKIFTYSWARKAIKIVLILVIATGIWFVVSVFTACIPLSAFWDWSLYMADGDIYCQPPNLWWGIAALHVTSDLIIVLLPMPVLVSLKLPRRQKLALVAMFGLGFFVCIVSSVRLVAFVNIQNGRNWDRTYTGAQIQFWSTVEVNASIVCACIMTMKPLVQKWFPNLLAGSYVRGHSLRWITPLHSSTRNSRQSTQPIAPAEQRAVSTVERKDGEVFLTTVEEREGDVCEEKTRGDDLEAQRAGSVSTVVGDHDDDGSVVGMSALRAPPRAHLRLSIHATKSVRVSKCPESPEPEDGQLDEKTMDGKESMESQQPGKENRCSSPGWQSEGETVVVGGKDWAVDAPKS